jgi:hypothetical protein
MRVPAAGGQVLRQAQDKLWLKALHGSKPLGWGSECNRFDKLAFAEGGFKNAGAGNGSESRRLEVLHRPIFKYCDASGRRVRAI